MRLQAKYVIPCVVLLGTGSLCFFLSVTTRNTPVGDPTSSNNLDLVHENSGQHALEHLDSLQSVEEYQQTRRRQIRSACRLEGSWETDVTAADINPSLFSRIYYDDKYKLLYCEVPKVACTNWKRILLILTGRMNTSNPEDLPSALVHSTYQEEYLTNLSDLSPKEIAHRLKTYYKFLFVRDPLERILSAYKNKFEMRYSVTYQKRFGTKIIKRYRENPTDEALAQGHDVTFPEFIRFLLDPRTKRPLDAHWRPYHLICRPCLVHYDFIGKYETLTQDVDAVLDTLGVRHLLHFPSRPKKTTRTADILQEAYANISTSDIHQLVKLYSVDFKMFGYDAEQLLGSLR